MQDSRVLAFVLEKLKMQEICFEAVRQAEGALRWVPEEEQEAVVAAVRKDSTEVPEEGAGPRA